MLYVATGSHRPPSRTSVRPNPYFTARSMQRVAGLSGGRDNPREVYGGGCGCGGLGAWGMPNVSVAFEQKKQADLQLLAGIADGAYQCIYYCTEDSQKGYGTWVLKLTSWADKVLSAVMDHTQLHDSVVVNEARQLHGLIKTAAATGKAWRAGASSWQALDAEAAQIKARAGYLRGLATSQAAAINAAREADATSKAQAAAAAEVARVRADASDPRRLLTGENPALTDVIDAASGVVSRVTGAAGATVKKYAIMTALASLALILLSGRRR